MFTGALALALMLGGCGDDEKPVDAAVDSTVDGPPPDAGPDTGPTGVQAVFDPLKDPAEMPMPTDFYKDPATGLLNVPVADATSAPAQAYYDKFLNTLDGYPSHGGTVAELQFTGELDSATVTKDAFVVLDVTDTSTPATVANLAYEYVAGTGGRSSVRIFNPAGWSSGNVYAIFALNTLKDTKGNAVLRTQAFDLAAQSAALCDWDDTKAWDATAGDCTDPAPGGTATGCCTNVTSTVLTSLVASDKLLEKGTQLERLRKSYDTLLGLDSTITRDDVVALWSFSVVSMNRAMFKPPTAIPMPNGMLKDFQTGMLNVPVPADATAADKEYIEKYLNTLDDWPASSTGTLSFSAELDDTTASAGMLVFELDKTAGPSLVKLTDATVSYDATTQTLEVSRDGNFKRGATLILVAVGNDTGLKNKDATVSSYPKRTAEMHLVLSPEALCTFDSTTHTCSDTKVSYFFDDPAGATGAMSALQKASYFETMRDGYSKLADMVAAAESIQRDDIVALWSFNVTSMTEVIYDPVGGNIPFPNELLRDQTTGLVDLPQNPAIPEEIRLVLNTLDGFSTQGTSFAAVSGPVDKASMEILKSYLAVDFTGNPISMTFDYNDKAGAITATPPAPLEEKSTYAMVLISKFKAGDLKPVSGLTDDQGRRLIPSPFFAWQRSKAKLYDETTQKSLTRFLSDSTAQQIEQARASFEPLFDQAESMMGMMREDLVCAWAYTTQTITDPIPKLRALPWSILGALDSNQPKLTGTLDPTLTGYPTAFEWDANKDGQIVVPPTCSPAPYYCDESYPVPTPTNIAAWIANGTFKTWNKIDEQGTQAFLPGATDGKPEDVPFILTIPKGTMPANGWPLIVYQHGTPTVKERAVYVADDLAGAGFATISFDMIYHGKRTWCTQDAHCTAGGTCDTTTGQCSTALVYWDPAKLTPVAGSARFLNTSNPFGIRDNIRQHVIDSAALFRTIALGGASGITGGTVAFDLTQVHYLTRSLGGMNGTVVAAADSLPKRVMLGVPGAPWVTVASTSSYFAPLWDGLLQGFNVQKDTLAYLQLTNMLQWILDPADPGNFAAYIKTKQLDDLLQTPAGKIPAKEVMIQLAGKDTFVPTPTGQYLANAMGVSVTDTTYPNQDHLFLQWPDPAGTDNATKAARAQMVNWFVNGTVCKPDTTAGTCNMASP